MEAISIVLSVGICAPELSARTAMLLGNRTCTTASCLRDNGGARAFSYSLGFFCMQNEKRETSSACARICKQWRIILT